PDRVELAEESRRMVESCEKIHLVQKSANVSAGITYCRGRDVRELVVQVGLCEFITRAQSQVISNQLVYVNRQRPLPEIEPLARARRAVRDRDENAIGKRAHGRVHLRVEEFSKYPQV